MAFKLQPGDDIVIHLKKDGAVKPYYPFSKTTNIVNEDGKSVDELLAEKAGIDNAVPDPESPDDLRFLGNDNKWRNLPTASESKPGVVQVASDLEGEESGVNIVPNIEIVRTLSSKITDVETKVTNDVVLKTEKGRAGGVATLDEYGMIPSSQLPSFVDDIVEGYVSDDFTKFYRDAEKREAVTLETGKIYVDIPSNKTYRYSGTILVEISSSLALGETSSTAFPGDKGKEAYDHSQTPHARVDATKTENSSTNGYIKIDGKDVLVYTHPIKYGYSVTNPHGTTKEDVGLGYVENISGEAAANKYVTKNLIIEKLGFTPTSAEVATQDKDGLMSKTDKVKLDTMMRTVVGSENSSNNVFWLKTLTEEG